MLPLRTAPLLLLLASAAAPGATCPAPAVSLDAGAQGRPPVRWRDPAGFAPRARAPGPPAHALGLFATALHSSLQIERRTLCRGAACTSCPQSVELTYRLVDPVILLHPSLAASSCAHRLVLDHELAHWRVQARAVADAVRRLPPAVRAYVASQRPRVPGRGRSWLDDLGRLFDDFQAHWARSVQQANDRLDSPASYALLTRRLVRGCGFPLPQLPTSRGPTSASSASADPALSLHRPIRSSS